MAPPATPPVPPKFATVCSCTLFFTLIVIAIILLATSFQRVKSTEVGIAYDTVAKKLGKVQFEGLHNGPPLFKMIKFPSTYRTLATDIQCVSGDGLQLGLSMSYQYRINVTRVRELVVKYRNNKKYEGLMAIAATSAFHWTCAQFQIGDFQPLRQLIQNVSRDRLQQIAAPLLASVVDVQLRNVKYPDEWAKAVANKEQARFDIDLAMNERNQSLAQANGVLMRATQEALVIAQNASLQVSVISANANSTAGALLFQYRTQAEGLAAIKRDLNLTDAGLVAYVTNRALEQSTKPLDVALDPPAQGSYAAQL